ncbi:MAG TPA: energy transducer TonB [bacterium]|jgi:TonB family protein|nr:energy transducer TonB [bacterium]
MTVAENLLKSGEDEKRFYQAAGTAIGLEVFFFLALGLGHLPFLRNPFDSANYVEAQIVQLPADAHLTGAAAVQDEDEVVFSQKQSHKKKVEKREPPKAPEQNQVNAGPDLGPTHGPVAFYAPAPVIPAYLRDQNLKTSVVIEFLITAQGAVTPRLLESSGNDELDAIALRTASKWQFKPAAQNNILVDSKTRLRILFEVY